MPLPAVLLVAALAALTACESETESESESESESGSETGSGAGAGHVHEHVNEHESDALREAAGGRSARCEGASLDPAQLPLASAAAVDGDVEGSLRGLEALAGAHPGSATARVRLGELSLRTDPPRAPTAERWFDRALALHDDGCTLASADLWRALEGAALSRMMQGDYAAAAPHLERSLDRWPDVPATRYNLACVRCQTGDVDACAAELGRVLDGAGALPDFLADQARPREHYVDMARRDPDLAPLRADRSRFEALVAPR